MYSSECCGLCALKHDARRVPGWYENRREAGMEFYRGDGREPMCYCSNVMSGQYTLSVKRAGWNAREARCADRDCDNSTHTSLTTGVGGGGRKKRLNIRSALRIMCGTAWTRWSMSASPAKSMYGMKCELPVDSFCCAARRPPWIIFFEPGDVASHGLRRGPKCSLRNSKRV